MFPPDHYSQISSKSDCMLSKFTFSILNPNSQSMPLKLDGENHNILFFQKPDNQIKQRWKEIVHKQHMSNPLHWPGKMPHRCIHHSHFVSYSLGVYQDKPSCPTCRLLYHEACQTVVLFRCTLSKNYFKFEFQNK
jgi:hypothetical protein